MLRFLGSLLTLKVVERASAEAERYLDDMQFRLRQTAISLVWLRLSLSLVTAGAGLILAAAFLYFAELPRFIWPSIWTSLVSFGAALICGLVATLSNRR